MKLADSLPFEMWSKLLQSSKIVHQKRVNFAAKVLQALLLHKN